MSSPPASAASAAVRPFSGRTAPSWSRSSAGWTIAPTSRTGPQAPTSGTPRRCSGYLAHRFTGALRDTAANNILLQWPIDTDTWQWSDDASLYDTFGVAREALAELQLPGEVIGPATAEASAATWYPRRHGNRPDRERQGRGGARRRPAGRAHRARLARHLHRRDGARQREPPDARPLLDELRLPAAPLSLREPRHPARDVDADVVPRPARRRGRRAGGLARPLARALSRAGGRGGPGRK